MIELALIATAWAGMWLGLTAVAQRRTPTLAQLLRPSPAPPQRWTDSVGHGIEWLVTRLGVRSELSQRLIRAADTRSVETFRASQTVAAGTLAVVVIGLGTLAGAPQSALLGLGILVALVAVLVCEQALVERGDRRRNAAELELPVVAEQLSILLASGSSVGTALAWVARRGHGVLAEEFGTTHDQIAHGLEQSQALDALGKRLGSERVRRLCLLLALDHRAADLGHLVAQEAAVQRREAHHALLAEIERRSQKVWIPITLAALVPGSIVLAIPLLDSLRAFNQL